MNSNKKVKKAKRKVFVSLAFISFFLFLLGSLFIVTLSPKTERVNYNSPIIETHGTINSIINYILKMGSSNFITGANIGVLTAGDDTSTANGWNKTFNGKSATGSDEALSITINPSGDIFVGGYGTDLFNSSSQQDMWVKKFSTNGNENLTHWNISFNHGCCDLINDIVSDSDGNIYLAGEGTNIFNTTSNFDWWIKKIFANGTEDSNWNKTIYSSTNGGTDQTKAITVDTNNNVFVVGYGSNLVNSSSLNDWWIKKFNSSGSENTTNWNLTFDRGDTDIAEDIVIDPSGNIFIAGEGTNLANPSSGYDWWIKKFLANGTEDSSWNKSVGTTNQDNIYEIKLDAIGNLYVVGFSDDLVSGSSGYDWWIKKFNSSGSEDILNWNKTYDKSTNDIAYDVEIDNNNNNVYIVGTARNIFNSTSTGDWWIKKFNSSGSEDITNWNLSFDGKKENTDTPYKTLNNYSNLYVVGSGTNLNSSTSASDWWIKIINTTTNPTDCGTITSSITLIVNKTANGNCYIIEASNIFIDGAGFAINGNGSGIGVNNTGFSNVTIKNLQINNFTTNIHIKNSPNNTIYNNTILPVNSTAASYGIYLEKSNYTNVSSNTITSGNNTNVLIALYFTTSSNEFIISNNITTSGSFTLNIVGDTSSHNLVSLNTIVNTVGESSDGIEIYTLSSFNNISNNNITTTGTNSRGVYIGNGNDSIIDKNSITSNGEGIYLIGTSSDRSHGNYITNNNITSTGTSGGYGIRLGDNQITATDVNNTQIINNNISATKMYELFDETDNATRINYLIYNNTFGEIRWINITNESFLKNLTTNVSNSDGMGLGRNIIIDSNLSALNNSAFTVGKIATTSVNITLKNLPFSSVNQIIKDTTYRTNKTQMSGSDCVGGEATCTIISYSGGTILFNTTSFSSYMAASVPVGEACGTVNSNTNVSNNISTTGTCFIINSSNIILY